MFDGVDYSSSASEGLMEVESSSRISTKRKRSKNKRRFRDEQIRCLELMFESDTKLEPRKKAHLAKELGLQPRQIAIWFQNRRARWKSKQIEKDYTLLLSDYNNLSSQFESLKKENHSLSLQLEKLEKLKNEMSGNAEEKTQYEIQQSSDGEQKIDFETLISDEDSSMLLLGLDREMVEPGSLTSSEDWGSDDLIIHPTGWWDFWG